MILALVASILLAIQALAVAAVYSSSYSTPSRYKGGLWRYAHATFYGEYDALETMGKSPDRTPPPRGACGYGNLYSQGYGTDTTALSTVLFNSGYGCGGCYEISCTQSKHCYPGSTIVTATNLCPPNWYKPSNNGGWCNPPRIHFDMSKPAFSKIAYWRAGIVPVRYRRVPCRRKGGIKFELKGNRWWLIVFVSNVGGPGDIKRMAVKGSKTGWLPMSRNWGVGFQVFKSLHGQSLSFMVTSFTTGKTVTAYDVVPANWRIGQAYSGGQMV
ncbi:hypothetical protein SELMODRAFT_78615 [Selaginella moellendorffii]|uniref:Expansin n=1 Tax=Selaginella moellendorffii TaxID=88036 RepID=D8QWA7_SELML|nr:hypothetical protein SELMODRAFT_78615 [Selaginella moellendorffii]